MVGIGLHHKNARATTRADLRNMKRLVEMPEVVGFGEIGLDRTSPVNEWDDQLDILQEVGQFIDRRHVVILHCRRCSIRDHDHHAYRILLHHMRRMVRRNQSIHLHCFNGDPTAVSEWSREFPNTYFGFTRIVDTFDRDQRDALKMVGSTRLLLETDAPYFQFNQIGKHSTRPSDWITAERVALFRGCPHQEILRVTTENARQLYGARR